MEDLPLGLFFGLLKPRPNDPESLASQRHDLSLPTASSLIIAYPSHARNTFSVNKYTSGNYFLNVCFDTRLNDSPYAVWHRLILSLGSDEGYVDVIAAA
jgi:hypothetical protein